MQMGATIDYIEEVMNSNGDTFTPNFEFETGNSEFRDESGVQGTDYEKIYSRKIYICTLRWI